MVAGWMMSVTTSLPPRVMVRLEVRSVVMVLTSVLVSVRRLVLRMGEPGLYCPQSVAVYNSISVTAFVQTDQDQALDPEAFKLLLSIVREDLQNRNLPMPKYLLRYTAQFSQTLHTT